MGDKTCNILGNQISVIDMSATVEYLKKNTDMLRGRYVCVCNVHTTVMAYENEQYRNIQNGAVLNLPDGKPLTIVGHHHGYMEMGRVAGPDLMEEVFRISAEQKWRHYFYGSTSETLGALRERLERVYQGIQIVGMYAPPFRDLTIEEDAEIVNSINEKKPDFIWIGLGAPKQEIFMYHHREQLDGVMIGVGAGFNFHAGMVKRAPLWMQRIGLEWFYRMMQEPGRLWKRYFKTNWKFLKLVRREGMVR